MDHSPRSTASPGSPPTPPTPGSPQDPHAAVLAELGDAFTLFDRNMAGRLRRRDVPFVLRAAGLSEAGGLDEAQLDDMVHAMDPRHTGFVTRASLLEVALPAFPAPGSIGESWASFQLFDRGHKGHVTMEDLVALANVEGRGLLSERQCAYVVSELKHSRGKPGLTMEDWRRALDLANAA